MLQKQKFFFVLFVIDLQRLRDMRGCGNLAFSAWKNGHVDFPHTFDATPGLSAGSVYWFVFAKFCSCITDIDTFMVASRRNLFSQQQHLKCIVLVQLPWVGGISC
jgi:hypothetical protein